MTKFTGRRVVRALSVLTLTAVSAAGMAQQLPFCAADKPGLCLDYNRLWDYNLYEGSRFGLGTRLTLAPSFGHFTADAYVGYGLLDKQWKYGLLADARLSGRKIVNGLYLGVLHDYFSVGSLRMANPGANGSQLLGSFMARRMTVQDLLKTGLRGRYGAAGWLAEVSLGRRAPLFANGTMLYLFQGDTLSWQPFASLKLAVRHDNGLMAQAEWIQPFGHQAPSLRLLAGYVRSRRLGLADATLSLLAGATPQGMPYVDLFDLGGNRGAPLYVGQAFSTANANEFTANVFAQVGVVVRLAKPLWSVHSDFFSVGSNPRPFLELKAMWGTLWEAGPAGAVTIDGIYAQAPTKGYAEAVAGVDGLVRWGAVDFGAALAARLVPAAAVYHIDGVSANLSPLFTATLLI